MIDDIKDKVSRIPRFLVYGGIFVFAVIVLTWVF